MFYEARNHCDRPDKLFLRKLYPSVSRDSISLKQGFSLNLKEVDSVSQSVSDRAQLVWDSIHA